MRSINKKIFIGNLICMGLILYSLMVLTSCKKLYSDPMPTSFAKPPEIAEVLPTVFVSQTMAIWVVGILTYGNTTSVLIEYGPTISYGNSKTNLITIKRAYGSTSSSFILTGLSPGKTYHIRIKATSSYGTTTGTDNLFTTLNPGESGIIFNPDLTYSTLTDIEGIKRFRLEPKPGWQRTLKQPGLTMLII
jgi:hypothetical protein